MTFHHPLDAAKLLAGRRAAVLSGAGLSTESGIPDYRGPGTRMRARSPIQHRDFVSKESVRRRYWARSFAAYDRFWSAQPNAGHHAVSTLQRHGLLGPIITQNVDGLHQASGATEVIELHGTLSQVKCLDCDSRETRKALQERLRELNGASENVGLAPDGDAEVAEESYANFVTVACRTCGGILKPTVVFFGDNVPRPVVDAAFAGVDQADALLLLGTSLAVFSGYRFLLRAHERKLPIVAINLGEMRGAELCNVLVAQPLGAALGELVNLLLPQR